MKNIFNHAFLSNCILSSISTRECHIYLSKATVYVCSISSQSCSAVSVLLASAHFHTHLNETACVERCSVLCLQRYMAFLFLGIIYYLFFYL